MIYTGYELLCLFLTYSFLGWVLETVVAALKQKRFVNRGLINSPMCVVYGAVAVIITIYLRELQGFWLFLGAAIIATVGEWITGRISGRVYHERWWDYSQMRWNLDGYICLPVSLVWGALGYLSVRWGNQLLVELFALIPAVAGKVIVWIIVVILIVDALATLIIMSGKSKRLERWEAADAWFTKLSKRLGMSIVKMVNRRIRRAYPRAAETEVAEETRTRR